MKLSSKVKKEEVKVSGQIHTECNCLGCISRCGGCTGCLYSCKDSLLWGHT